MKNVLVVGGASGIGKGMVNALSAYYNHVFVADIQVQPQQATGQYLHVDAFDKTSVGLLQRTLSAKITHLDALIITIGVIDQGSILNVPLEKWEWMLKGNLLGAVQLVDAFLPLLQASREGRILLTGSGSGWGRMQAESGLGLYTVTKHAVNGYYKALRAELATQNIQVSLLVPSAIKGNLATHSAALRSSHLGEVYSDDKGQQLPGRILEDADSAGYVFVADFIAGKAVITNNVALLLGKGTEDLEDLID